MPVLQDPIDINSLSIASPCTVPWESMKGDDRKRFCGQCRLHVHNFSEMTGDEIRDLFGKGDGRVCGQIWRRADGTIVTADCVKTRRARARKAAARGLGLAATLLASTALGLGLTKAGSPEELITAVKNSGPVQAVLGMLGINRGVPPPVLRGKMMVKGEVFVGGSVVATPASAAPAAAVTTPEKS